MSARISIVTPVFNGARYIAACVQNVVAQNVEGLEHIVVDGSSTDGTIAILEKLKTQYDHLKYVSERDSGQSDAMNKGVRMASAELIGVLNADDFYEPGAIREAVEFLESNPPIDFVTGDCNMRDENDVVTHINRPRDLRPESILLGWEYAEYPVNPSAYFYRKRIHDVVGNYIVSEHYAMDVCFIYSCATKVKTAYQPRLWGNFRHLPGTKTVSNQTNAPRIMRDLRRQYIRKLPLGRRLPLSIKAFFWNARLSYWQMAKALKGNNVRVRPQQ